jgi:hypothetical protein
MSIIIGHICAMITIVGLLCFITPTLRVDFLAILFWGIFFGLMSGTAQTLLLGK